MTTETEPPPSPRGMYSSITTFGGLAFVAGMTPRGKNGLLFTGVVGRDVTLEEAMACARLAVQNALKTVDREIGLGCVLQYLRLTVYIAGVDTMAEHSAIADAASGALVGTIENVGLPARSAVGVSSLPGGAPVEVELTIAYDVRRATDG